MPATAASAAPMTKVSEMVRSTLTPEQRCHAPVLLRRALGAAQRRAGDQQRESHHQDDGEGDDADLQVADFDIEPVLAHQAEAAAQHVGHRLVAGALKELDIVLQQNRHADGGDERRQSRRAPQRPIGHALHGPAVDRGDDHGEDQNQQEGERHPGDAEDAENQESDQRVEGADHVDVAMGEVDHADDAVDHRIADGDKAVDGAERDSVDQLLNEECHRPPIIVLRALSDPGFAARAREPPVAKPAAGRKTGFPGAHPWRRA